MEGGGVGVEGGRRRRSGGSVRKIGNGMLINMREELVDTMEMCKVMGLWREGGEGCRRFET